MHTLVTVHTVYKTKRCLVLFEVFLLVLVSTLSTILCKTIVHGAYYAIYSDLHIDMKNMQTIHLTSIFLQVKIIL